MGVGWEGSDENDFISIYGEGESKKPDDQYIDKVGKLESPIELQTVYEEGNFRQMDAVYKIIALAWEIVGNYAESEVLPENILVFHYGDAFSKVKEKLFSKDLKIRFD